ncbi:MAG: hypothetical protein ACOC1F_12040, partial [Myxococcota bacterium]
RPDLMLEGQIELRPMPDVLDTSPWPTGSQQGLCTAPAPRNAWLSVESEATSLSSDLAVDVAGVPLAGDSVPAGTNVTSFLLHRRPGEASAALLTFARPVLGVITSQGRLEASDAAVGTAGTTYPTEPRATEGEDEVALSADGRAVTVSFTGADTDQIRIVTEAP